MRAAQDIDGPNYEGFRGTVSVTRDGRAGRRVLHPEKRRYWVQGTVQTTAAIAPGLQRDLLAALGEDVGAGAWSLRLQYRPLIRFVWLGGADHGHRRRHRGGRAGASAALVARTARRSPLGAAAARRLRRRRAAAR